MRIVCRSTHAELRPAGSFMNIWDIYEDLQDIVAVRQYMEEQMDEYNVSPGVVRIDLILFRDAIEHICRIVRIISQVSDSRRLPNNGKHFIRRNALLKVQIRPIGRGIPPVSSAVGCHVVSFLIIPFVIPLSRPIAILRIPPSIRISRKLMD
jgi:hypothetical protein